MNFDTDGITTGEVENPYGQIVFSLWAIPGVEVTGDITEMFQERVEPPIKELESALGCEPSEDAIWLDELFTTWAAGWYEFGAESGGTEFDGRARLTHRIPAGPEILAPEDGAIVDDDRHLRIRWNHVTEPLLDFLVPVGVVGYRVVIADVTKPTLAPGQFLEPGRIDEFEVLATERRGNQTITEGGAFCTPPIDAEDCEAP